MYIHITIASFQQIIIDVGSVAKSLLPLLTILTTIVHCTCSNKKGIKYSEKKLVTRVTDVRIRDYFLSGLKRTADANTVQPQLLLYHRDIFECILVICILYIMYHFKEQV